MKISKNQINVLKYKETPSEIWCFGIWRFELNKQPLHAAVRFLVQENHKQIIVHPIEIIGLDRLKRHVINLMDASDADVVFNHYVNETEICGIPLKFH